MIGGPFRPVRPVAAVDADAGPRTVTAEPFHNDHHDGNPNLGEYPPSSAELHFASRVLHDPSDEVAHRNLLAVAQSTRRAWALVRLARRERAAADMLRRAAP